MKALVCELCGSNDILKVDGYFICQHCGTKYSVEEARKMMIEGTVDVSGSVVKVDNSGELENLYQLARRAKSDNNSENAQKYYEMILVKDPSSWEANFYAIYYQSMSCTIAGIQNAAVRLINCEDTVLNLIKDNISDIDKRKNAVNQVAGKLIAISMMLFNAAKNHYDKIDYQIKANYTQGYLNSGIASRDIVYKFGDYVISMFGDIWGKDIAVPCWKVGVNEHIKLLPLFANTELNKNVISGYINKIKQYDEKYEAPSLATSTGATSTGATSTGATSTAGCYIATSIYGSYNCPQVWTLRRYRDFSLATTWYGRTFISIYYAISPIIVRWFAHTEWFRHLFKKKLDRFVASLNMSGVASDPYEDKMW